MSLSVSVSEIRGRQCDHYLRMHREGKLHPDDQKLYEALAQWDANGRRLEDFPALLLSIDEGEKVTGETV